MSTRCQIAIFDQDISDKLTDTKFLLRDWAVLLYRHSDGYPEGIIPDIKPFVQEFIDKRGHDAEYLGACLIAYLKHWHCGESNKQQQAKLEAALTSLQPSINDIQSKINDPHTINVNDFSIDVFCHGISKKIHLDIEYFYAIDETKAGANIYVFEVSYSKEDVVYSIEEDLKLTLIETHEIIKKNDSL